MDKKGWILLIVAVIVVLLIVYYYMKSGSTVVSSSVPVNSVASAPVSNSSSSSSGSSSSSSSSSSSAPSVQGVFLYIPPQGNTTYAQAQTIAAGMNVAIASPAQLLAGGQSGSINACAYGWLSNGQPGLYMQTATTNCGPQGLSYNVSTTAAGIWLYGNIPQSVLSGPSSNYAIV